MTRVRVAAAVDKPYSFKCFPSFSTSKSSCPKPGMEIEYIHMVLVHMMHLEIEWLMAGSIDEMIDMIKKFVLASINFLIEICKFF